MDKSGQTSSEYSSSDAQQFRENLQSATNDIQVNVFKQLVIQVNVFKQRVIQVNVYNHRVIQVNVFKQRVIQVNAYK